MSKPTVSTKHVLERSYSVILPSGPEERVFWTAPPQTRGDHWNVPGGQTPPYARGGPSQCDWGSPALDREWPRFAKFEICIWDPWCILVHAEGGGGGGEFSST